MARKLGLPSATLRTWEARYASVVPERSPGGQRLYTREQVAALRSLKEAVAAGTRPGEAHRLLDERRATRDAPSIRIVASRPGALAGVLLRHVLERDGFRIDDDANVVVVDVVGVAGVLLTDELKRDGHRVLALVEAGAGDPAADVVLRLPIAPHELVDAARRLAAQ